MESSFHSRRTLLAALAVAATGCAVATPNSSIDGALTVGDTLDGGMVAQPDATIITHQGGPPDGSTITIIVGSNTGTATATATATVTGTTSATATSASSVASSAPSTVSSSAADTSSDTSTGFTSSTGHPHSSSTATSATSVSGDNCSHSPCVPGAALSKYCDENADGLVDAICSNKSSCCDDSWTASCAQLATELCEMFICEDTGCQFSEEDAGEP